jgi:hypothetical protein
VLFITKETSKMQQEDREHVYSAIPRKEASVLRRCTGNRRPYMYKVLKEDAVTLKEEGKMMTFC